MLKQISCALFKEGDTPRPPIQFHQGLNTILGAVRGEAGSIGTVSYTHLTLPTNREV